MPLFSLLSRENYSQEIKQSSSQTAINIKNRRLKKLNNNNNNNKSFNNDNLQQDQSNWSKTWNLLKQLADILTPLNNNNNNNNDSQSNELYISDSEDDTEDDDNQSFITTRTSFEKEKSPICDLFPSKNNVQNLEFNSVTPCSMNINLMENPIQFETLPNGMISSTLNKNGFIPLSNSPSLPISPQSNNSPNSNGLLDGKLNTPQSIPDNNVTTKPNNDDQGSFICHYCDATFKIRGYLTRHIKKHAIEKAYHCPFYDKNLPPELRCHNSGGFSRRDTYKTHLKARHFTFPNGVKANDRNKSDGCCSHCGEHFNNADDWINNHLETGKCTKLPEEYLIELKNKLKNKKKTNNKLKMIKTSTGHSRFVSSADSVIEQKVLKNKEALEAIAIVAGATDNNAHTNNHVLSKYGDNQFVLNSENFEGHKKPKRKYKPRKNKLIQNVVTPGTSTNNTTTNTSSVDNTPRSSSNEFSTQPHQHQHTMTYGANVINGMDGFIPSPSNLMLSNGVNPIPANNNQLNYSLNESPYIMRSTPPVSLTKTSSAGSSSSVNNNMNNIIIPQQQQTNGQMVANSVINSFTPITSQSSASSMSSTTSSNFLAPLDIEQQSMYEPFEEISNTIHNIPTNTATTTTQSQFDTQLAETYQPDKINEVQMKETKQYLNFYNFIFGSNL